MSEPIAWQPRPAWLSKIQYNDKGLVPCVVQERTTSEVLMMAWMNEESLKITLDTRKATYYSRSRGRLWEKGEDSGNTQHVHSLHLDCDGDTLLMLVDQKGGACHTGELTCWDAPNGESQETRSVGGGPRVVLAELLRLIQDRDRNRPQDSYTTKLLIGGVDRSGKKVGEEATEVVIAAKNAIFTGGDTAELAEESADLLYHLLVLWQSAGIDHATIMDALRRRR